VSARPAARFLGASLVTAWAILNTAIIPSAGAAACPDIEVVFARSTGESPGVGYFGQAFVDSLRKQVGGKSMAAYGVNYPAGYDFSSSASAGAKDASAHVQYTAVTCPNTKIVLGGHSQGAGVIDLVGVGPITIWFLTPAPLPAAAASHVAAVAVFGNPSRTVPGLGPLTAISPQFATKTVDMCAPGDPFCSGGFNIFAHFSYVQNGMIDQAATLAASRL
jgi:cutinase